MLKTSRVIYFIFAIIAPILIGALHTFTHFNQLLTPFIQEQLSPLIPINGVEVSLWNTWGLMSFMMGFAFIIIGLSNSLLYRNLQKKEYPSILMFAVIMFYCTGALYAAHLFQAIPQFYGSLVALAALSLGLIIRIKKGGKGET